MFAKVFSNFSYIVDCLFFIFVKLEERYKLFCGYLLRNLEMNRRLSVFMVIQLSVGIFQIFLILTLKLI